MFMNELGSVGIGGFFTPINSLDISGGMSIGNYYSSAAPANGLIVSGNVGIGTTSPSGNLHVKGATSTTVKIDGGTATSESWIHFLQQSAFKGAIGMRNNRVMTFYNGGDRMVILSGGNVGIGTTSPTAKLEVSGTARITDLAGSGDRMVVADADGDLSTQAIGTGPTYTIGLWPELGGYVFRVSADGKHGLVVETQNQGSSRWYNAKDPISNPAQHSVNGQKFSDWRLPTRFELNEIYLQKGAIGGFSAVSTSDYWSSAEANYDRAGYQSFTWGGQSYFDKSAFYNVRSVRAF